MSTGSNGTKFSVARMLSVTKRVLKQIIRDRRTFAMIIVMPLIIMLVFGIALSGEIKHLNVAVDNQDQGPLGSQILSALQADNRVDVHVVSYQKGVDRVENGEYFASILIPSTFTQNITLKFNPQNPNPDIPITMVLYVDATKPAIQGTVLASIRDAMANSLPDAGVSLDQHFAYTHKASSGLDVSIPAVAGFVLTFLILLLSLLTLVRERIGGTQFRLFTTPLTKIERLMGYAGALSFFGFIEVLAIMVISILVFGVEVAGSLTLLLVSLFFYALVHVLMAVFMSNFAENELQAMQMAPLIALPSMALSGMLVPISSLPYSAEILSYAIPLRYGITIFEGIMLKGFGFAELWTSYLALLGFILFFFALALLTVKDEME